MAVRFSGTALDGQTVTMAVNGGTAVTQNTWGGGGDGGTLAITVQRSSIQVAPDSVDFWVDLTNTTFDTAGPTGSEIYDARLHEIIFLWDMGDTAGNWTAPVNVLSEWKDRNAAKGPFVKHMYTQPRPASGGAGTGYNVSVLAIEPSSGKTATASVELFVEDPDTVYAGVGPNRGTANTICISTSGNFTGAPAGADQITASVIDIDLLEEYGFFSGSRDGAKRFLLRHDEEFDLFWNINLHTDGWMLGKFGGSGKPVLNLTPVANWENGLGIRVEGVFANQNTCPDARIWGVKFKSTWNPVTQDIDALSAWAYAIWARGNCNMMLSDVEFEGVHKTAVAMDFGATNQGHMHLDNCINTTLGGDYALIYPGTSNVNNSVALTGCRFTNTPDGINDGGSKEVIRVTSCANVHMRGNDTYITCHERNHLRINGAAMGDGYLVNVHSNAMEGGAGGFTIAGNMTDSLNRSPVFNAIYDGNIWVGHYAGQQLIESSGTGITIRNNLAIMPAVPYDYDTPNRLDGFVKLTERSGYDPVIVGEAPIWVYNNTFVCERSNAQNDNTRVDLFYYGGGSAVFTRVEENNILHTPNMTPARDVGPLATTVLWTPRNPGLRLKTDAGTLITTNHVTPADAVKSYAPLSGSLGYQTGAATKPPARQNIALSNRGEPDNKGAW